MDVVADALVSRCVAFDAVLLPTAAAASVVKFKFEVGSVDAMQMQMMRMIQMLVLKMQEVMNE